MKQPRILLAPLALFVLFGLPLAILVLYSLAPGWRYPDLWPRRFDTRSLEFLFGQRWEILRSLGSSLAYSSLTVLTALAVCLAPARLLARREFRGKSLVEGLLLAPALIPAMTFSMGAHFLFIKAGLTDTMAGVVLVLTAFSYPYMLRALVAGYQSFGGEYELCAENLGAGPLYRLRKVEMPLIMPAVVAGGSVVFLVAFSEYFLVFLIGGGAVPSYTGYLFPYLNSSDRSVASLLTLLFLVAPIGLFLATDLAMTNLYRRKGMF